MSSSNIDYTHVYKIDIHMESTIFLFVVTAIIKNLTE